MIRTKTTKRTKFLGGITAAAVLTAGLVLGGAGAAFAGSGTLGAKSCGSSASVSTKANGNYRITFNAYIPNYGSRTLAKGSNSDSTVRWQEVYWYTSIGSRVEYASSGSASNSGSLSGLAWFCDY